MHQIVILGAGKSSSVLIEFLLEKSLVHDLFLHIGDLDEENIIKKTRNHPRSAAYQISNSSEEKIDQLIQLGDLVISLLPPSKHDSIAQKCLLHKKHFLNASYLSEEIKKLHSQVKENGLTFLLEMGLDPGIDHMSAMKMISDVQNSSGIIDSFASHCGGLVAPENDDNPWHYKISWNPKNVVLSGKDGAIFLADEQIKKIDYIDLFDDQRLVHVPGEGDFAWYPNRNSIPYMELYGLKGIKNFVRTTLRHPDFISGWKILVESKMTSEEIIYPSGTILSSSDFFDKHLKLLVNREILKESKIIQLMEYLGMNQHVEIPENLNKASDILQFILESKLTLGPNDKDMIVMLHEMTYTLENIKKKKISYLVIKGENQIKTAMAKTVGLPLALAAIQILQGNIKRKGVLIPVYEDIYNPILNSLSENGIVFNEM